MLKRSGFGGNGRPRFAEKAPRPGEPSLQTAAYRYRMLSTHGGNRRLVQNARQHIRRKKPPAVANTLGGSSPTPCACQAVMRRTGLRVDASKTVCGVACSHLKCGWDVPPLHPNLLQHTAGAASVVANSLGEAPPRRVRTQHKRAKLRCARGIGGHRKMLGQACGARAPQVNPA